MIPSSISNINPYEYAGFVDDSSLYSIPTYVSSGWMNKASDAWAWTRDNVLIDNFDRAVYNGSVKAFNWTVNTMRGFKMPDTPGLTLDNVFFAFAVMIFMTWVIGSVMDLCRMRRALDDAQMDGVRTMDGFTKPRRSRVVTRSMTAALDRDIMDLMMSVDEITARDIYRELSGKYPFITIDLVKSRLFEMRDNGDVLMTRERRSRAMWSAK